MLYLQDLPIDAKTSSQVRRRRIVEDQRKDRIFNPRQRIIGVDLAGLEQQTIDNRNNKESECRRKDHIESVILSNDKKSVLLEKAEKEEIRKLRSDIDHFRLNFQQPETRREFDINDPHLHKKELPTRESDYDPKCSVSGCQILMGEDIEYCKRSKVQKNQQRDWLIEQIAENNRKRDEEARRKDTWDRKMLQLDNKSVEMNRAELDARRAEAISRSQYNKVLHTEVKQRQHEDFATDQQKSLQEIYNNFFGDFLTENPRCARSSFGPHRIVSDRWKGMSKETHDEYHRLLTEQLCTNQRRREEAQRHKHEWDQLMLATDRKAVLTQREVDREKRGLNRSVAQENVILQNEQARVQNYFNRELYTNPPNKDYFDQFNTTTR